MGAPLHYTLAEAPSKLDLRIYTAEGELLGTKRFVDQPTIRCNIAPYLRPLLAATPQPATTGFITLPALPRTIFVEAVGETEQLTSEPRTLLPVGVSTEAPKLLTTLPAMRLIAPAESDLLLWRTEEPLTLTLTVEHHDGTNAQHSYTTTECGLVAFSLAAADFPEAAQLTLDGGSAGRVQYALLPQHDEGVRLAWRSRCGAIEHYTFEPVQHIEFTTERVHTYGPEGYRSHLRNCEQHLTLHSAYEGAAVMQALAELIATEEVWRVTAAGYEPVDVLSEKAEVHRRDTLGRLTIKIRSTQKNRPLWS